MRIVKNIVWIVLLTVAQTVFGRMIKIYGAVPNLLAAYSIIVAFSTESEKEAAYVLVACGILSGSCVGHIFPVEVLFIGIGSVFARTISDYFRFVPSFIRSQAVVLLTAFAIGIVECFVINRAIDNGALLRSVLPYTAYTLAASCVIYPLIMKTMFSKTEKKLMVV